MILTPFLLFWIVFWIIFWTVMNRKFPKLKRFSEHTLVKASNILLLAYCTTIPPITMFSYIVRGIIVLIVFSEIFEAIIKKPVNNQNIEAEKNSENEP